MFFKRIAAAGLVCVLLMCLLCPAAVSAAGGADLVVTALDWDGGDGQVTPGTKLTFAVTIKNIGDTAAAGPIDVDISFGTTVITRVTHNVSLAAGASVKLTSQPWTAVAGDKMIAARVNPTGAVPETNTATNNTRQSNLRVANDRVSPAYNADAVAEAGMFDLTFSDDFSDLSGFDSASTGREGYKWYIKRRWAQTDMTPADYSVKNGVLTLAYADDTYTIGASTVDCETHAGYVFNKGYLEARVRIPKPFNDTESKTAIWSLPIENWGEGLTNGRYVEMDWMEYFGDGDFYGTTLHDIENKSGGEQNWYSSSNGQNDDLNDAAWHVMGWLWEDNRLRCFIDGVEVFTQTWGAGEIPMPINKVESGDIQFEGVFEAMDAQDMMLFIAGSQAMPMEFDYVRIWQHGGTAPVTTTAATTTTTRVATTKTTAAKTTTAATATRVTAAPTVAKTTVTTERTTSTDGAATGTTQTTGAVTTTTVTTGTTAVAAGAEPSRLPAALVPIGAAVLAAAASVGVVLWMRKKK